MEWLERVLDNVSLSDAVFDTWREEQTRDHERLRQYHLRVDRLARFFLELMDVMFHRNERLLMTYTVHPEGMTRGELGWLFLRQHFHRQTRVRRINRMRMIGAALRALDPPKPPSTRLFEG